MRVGHILSQADRISDYIPVISTLSNAVDLVAKAIFSVIHINCLEGEYTYHLRDKSALRCALLLIPVIGNVAALLFSSHPKIFTDEELAKFDRTTQLKNVLEGEMLGFWTSRQLLIEWTSRLFPKKTMAEIAKMSSPLGISSDDMTFDVIRRYLLSTLLVNMNSLQKRKGFLASELILLSPDKRLPLLGNRWLFEKIDSQSWRVTEEGKKVVSRLIVLVTET